MLIAAVVALVLAWSVARLVMDSPVALPSNTPVLNGSDGTNNAFELLGDPVPVVLRAVDGGAHLVVRDGSGQVAFTGNLSYGESRTLKSVAPPVRVQSSDGSLVGRGSTARTGVRSAPLASPPRTRSRFAEPTGAACRRTRAGGSALQAVPGPARDPQAVGDVVRGVVVASHSSVVAQAK